jgi:endonuclease/exonuclease/phosphatase family metal-dependent hydrolase
LPVLPFIFLIPADKKDMKILVLIIILTISTLANDTLRVATYNILNYNGSNRNAYFTTVTQSIDADVIIVQEIIDQNAVNTFNSTVLNNQYATISFHDGTDTDNHVFYKSDKLTFISDNYLSTALRDIAEYQFRQIASDEILYIYSAHLKASTGTTNQQLRLAEATILRNHLNNKPSNTNFILVGDLNLYSSNEPAYQKLIGSESDNDGRLIDVVDSTGNWHDNNSFSFLHTQSTRVEQFGGGASGGLDDRFDLILVSDALLDNILINSYSPYGNDAQHLNLSINDGTNGAVSSNIADALYYASDHLPVYCDFVFDDLSGIKSDIEYPKQITLYQNFPNPANPTTTIKYEIPVATFVSLKVYNSLGEEVSTIVNGFKKSGLHSVQFNSSSISSGIYFYILQTKDQSIAKKLIILQ